MAAVRWDDVRYRGDAQDVEELTRTYRVNDYLDTFEENRRQADRGIREKLIKHGIRLSERISPRIYRLFGEVCARVRRGGAGRGLLPARPRRSTPSPPSTSASRAPTPSSA